MLLPFIYYAGKPYPFGDKEEKVNGYNHSFPNCVSVHVPYVYLLVEQVSRQPGATGEVFVLSFVCGL